MTTLMTRAYPSRMKVCFKCGAEKPLSKFYKHPKMKDGHVNKCKECNKKDVRENRAARKDYYQEYDRNRPNHDGRVARSNIREKELYKTDEAFRQSVLERKKKWEDNNPQKRKAQDAVNNAVRDGRLIKSHKCEHCGTSEKKIQGHHWSYEPECWLDVIWLCSRCHGKEHKRLNELSRDPDKPNIPFWGRFNKERG